MTVRFLHTSDWQLGMTRHYLQGEAQARYTAARIDAIRAVAEVVRRERVDFVVVAGDVFESNLVAAQTVRRSLEAMAAVPCPIYLLPGNHDPHDAVSVYSSRVFTQHCPDNVQVLTEAGSVSVSPGVEIVAAPWRTKATLTDLVAQALRPLSANPDVQRIVLAHGAIDVLKPDADDLAVISLAELESRLEEGVAHYVALGDKHTRLAVGRSGRIHYSGSPEVTSFREALPGDVLVVDLVPGAEPVVTPHHIGTWRFCTIERDIAGDADIDELDAELGALDPKDRTVVRLGLRGTLTLADKARLDTLLDAYADALAGWFTWTGHHDVAVVVAEDELADLGVGGFVDTAVAELAAQATGSMAGADPAAARDALSLLYRLARGPAA